jgi:hypothetical protein
MFRNVFQSSTFAFLAVLLITVFLCLYKFQVFSNVQTSYWIWAGITAKDAPVNSELYVYQGIIVTKELSSTYQRIGLYPHPIKSEKLYLSFRLEGDLPESQFVMDAFNQNIKGWKRHKVEITGIQIDFDSATSKLLKYSDFLRDLRSHLPKEYALSITGLSDWAVHGNQKTMSDIVNVTDEVVFQLYQDRDSVENIDFYIHYLSKYPFPFRVGLLANKNNSEYINHLRTNSNFRGIIYFIQK